MTIAGRVRRRIGLAGIFAVLLQALLFGWHHHELVLSSPGGEPVLRAAATPLSPLAADDDCEICQALHQLHAAPAEFGPSPPLPALATADPLPEPHVPARAAAHLFQARAPPRS